MPVSLFGYCELPDELYGAIWGIAVFAVLQLAWRSTQVRNPRTIVPGTIVLVDRTRLDSGWLARVRLSECANPTSVKVVVVLFR